MSDLVKYIGGARWWLWLVLIIVVAYALHPLWAALGAAFFSPAIGNRLKKSVKEKQKEADDFQQISRDQPSLLLDEMDEAVEDYTVAEKTVEDTVNEHQDDDSPFME